MIRAVRCDDPLFKTIKFKEGFNVVLADRTSESSEKDSRNGLGKTTLIKIIDFCLGSSFKADHPLKQKELENWTFSLDLTFNGKDVTVSRNTSDHTKIFVEGDFSSWPIRPKRNPDGDFLKVPDWNIILGELMFGLSSEIIGQSYSPTFRSLMSYHIRNSKGAFETPFEQHSKQKTWDIQVNNAYLLGLNWEYASQFQMLRDKKDTLDKLKRAAKQGLLSGYMGTLGELEAEKIGVNEKVDEYKTDLTSFKVHPQYSDIEKEANSLTKNIHKIVNKRITNNQLLTAYEKSISEEKDVSTKKVENIYQEAGLFFPDNLKVKLNDLVEFHEQVITNRTSYLETEIKKIEREIESQNEKVLSLSKKRAELLEILQKHGALEEYNKLQTKLTALEQKLNEINDRIKNLKTFEKGLSDLKIKKEELRQKTRRDFDERKESVKKALSIFNKNSEYLYSEPGLLSIDITDTGYKYNVEIKRAGSHGIGKMKIFCYDLMVNQLKIKERNCPGLLIHDSTIFDGVDERQVARALELAQKESGGVLVVLASESLKNGDLLPVTLRGIANRTTLNILSENPLTENLDSNIEITRHLVASAKQGAIVLAEAGDESPIVAYWNIGRGHVIYLGFAEPGENPYDPLNPDVWNSFHATPTYPLFWQNLIEWSTGSIDINEFNLRAGTVKQYSTPVTIKTPTSNITTETVLFDEVGFYTMPKGEVAVNLYSKDESDITETMNLTIEETRIRYAPGITEIPKELDKYLIVAGILFILLELYYLRWRGEL